MSTLKEELSSLNVGHNTNRTNTKETMTNRKPIMIAMAGAALLAAVQAQAQTYSYANQDLILDFRQTSGAQGATA